MDASIFPQKWIQINILLGPYLVVVLAIFGRGGYWMGPRSPSRYGDPTHNYKRNRNN
jgi:hypothetical protein